MRSLAPPSYSELADRAVWRSPSTCPGEGRHGEHDENRTGEHGGGGCGTGGIVGGVPPAAARRAVRDPRGQRPRGRRVAAAVGLAPALHAAQVLEPRRL